MQRAFLLLLLPLAAACSGPPAEDVDLTTLSRWMTGSFSSAEQAAADSNYFDIRLHMQPIWTDREGPLWLYVEQAVATHQDAPYRQRIYRLRRLDAQTLESAVFLLPDPGPYVGAWRDPERLATLAPDSLVEREGCAIALRRVASDRFEGSTHLQDCPSELRGASYATSEVVLGADRLLSWDRGFDAEGRQVWGATGGGYVFLREP